LNRYTIAESITQSLLLKEIECKLDHLTNRCD
jgi:hypothetical protein